VTLPRVRPARIASAPLTHSQRSFWLLHRLDPTQCAYNVPAVFRVSGALDFEALQGSFDAVVATHPSLRTAFDPEEPVQRVHEEWRPRIDRVECDGDLAAARRWIQSHYERPFDLAAGPPVRIGLAHVGREEWLLSFVTHHVACDGWSLSLVFDDLSAAYRAALRGEAPDLRPPPVQPVDVAAWEASGEVRSHFDATLAWWVETFDGEPLDLKLPLDRAAGQERSMHGAVASRTLSAELTGRLEELARAERVSLFATLLVIWSAVLARRTGVERVPFVVPAAHRDRPEMTRVVGCFVTMLPLVIDLSDRPAIRDALSRVRLLMADVFDHRPPSLEAVLAALRRSHGPALRAPNSIFTLHTVEEARLDLPGAFAEPCELDAHSAVADLSLTVSATTSGLELRLRYPVGSVPRELVERLLSAFEESAKTVVDRPGAPVRELGDFSQEERAALDAWSRRDHISPLPPTVREAVEAQARRTPGAIAVSSEAVTLTYQSLDRRANTLGHRLHNLGARVETVVAVCLPPSPALVVAALAAMKAGAAYLPIDPAQPIGRLQKLLEDLDPIAVIAEDCVAQELEAARLRTLSIDVANLDERDDAPAAPAPSNALAYVIFTSGSTGRPKAAAVAQASFASFVAWLVDDYGIGQGDVCTQIVSPSFDASISEVWPCLVSGGTLIAPPRGLLADPEQLVDWLSGHKATCAFVPTSVALSMVRLSRHPKHLRLLLTGGEAFSGDVPDGLPFELVNQYGPAECSFIASRRKLPPRTAARGLSIGEPTGNVRLHVLDSNLERVALGVTGELYIGGLCVGRGYLRRPALTASAYLPDPFSEQPGARMYRTGDVACWQAEGTLVFIGRADRQVKISGCRVEPAEVESALMGHPAVGQAAVVAGPTAVGEVGLAAHVVPRVGHDVTSEELRAFLEVRLPRYMQPSTISLAASFPQLTSGKVDRSKLASPRDVWQLQGSVSPATETERQLADIWSSLLGIPVNPTDELFTLGASSLHFVRVQLAMQRTLGVKLPLDIFFERPTVSALARALDAARPGNERQPPPIPPCDLEAPGPPALAQTAMIALHNVIPDPSVFNVLLAVRFDGEVDEASLETAVNTLAERQPVFRTSVRAVDGMIEQVSSRQAMPWFRQSLADSDVEVRDCALDLLTTPFDLTQDPLLRAELIRCADHSILLLSTHHAFLDGWSTRLILRDLGAMYRAHRKGCPVDLAPLKASFAAYARWQRDALEAGAFDDQIGYWVAKLRDIRPIENLTDGSGPRLALRTAHRRVAITKSVIAGARARAASWGISEYVFHLTVFASAIASFSQDSPVGLAILTENRSRHEIEDVVGLFANTLPLALPIECSRSIENAARIVRAAVIDAQMHQEAPIDVVVQRAAAAGIDATAVQALFLFQDIGSYQLDFGDVRAALTDVLGADSTDLASWQRPTGFPLALLVETGPDGGGLTLLHNPGLVTAEKAGEILDAVTSRLEAATDGKSFSSVTKMS